MTDFLFHTIKINRKQEAQLQYDIFCQSGVEMIDQTYNKSFSQGDPLLTKKKGQWKTWWKNSSRFKMRLIIDKMNKMFEFFSKLQQSGFVYL